MSWRVQDVGVVEDRGDAVVDAIECSKVIGFVDVVRGAASQGGSVSTWSNLSEHKMGVSIQNTAVSPANVDCIVG